MDTQIGSLERLISSLQQLPGIGRRSAEKLALAVVNMPKQRVADIAESLVRVKNKIHLCRRCFNLSEDEVCSICGDERRNQHLLCVVEQPLDLWNLEKAKVYHGLYFVLHGHLNPLENIGPEELFIPQLLGRVQKEDFEEIILATNPTVEGETTAMYLLREIRRIKPHLKVSRLARGLSMGSDIEYVDPMTLKNAFENRK